MRILDSVALEGAELVGVPELNAELLEDRPVTFLCSGANLARQMAPQVIGHTVIVEQRVVDVEQKHDLA